MRHQNTPAYDQNLEPIVTNQVQKFAYTCFKNYYNLTAVLLLIPLLIEAVFYMTLLAHLTPSIV